MNMSEKTMQKFGESKLCADCPLTKAWKDEALRRIREREMIKTREQPSSLKVCMERRKILRELGLTCPYFNYGFDFSKTTGYIDEG